MLTQVNLSNFRGFKSLALPELKRVNLIVGHNNSGKTSLLEALLLICEPYRIHQLPGLFRAKHGNIETRYFRWLRRDKAEERTTILQGKCPEGIKAITLSDPVLSDEAIPAEIRPYRIYQADGIKAWASPQPENLSCRAISVQHIDPKDLVTLVGKTLRKKTGEETLQRLLNKVDPRIKKIRIDPGDGPEGNQIIVDIGLSELVPLTQCGQGIYRLTTIISEIIGDQPKVLLIDEIENGLHHSVLNQVWSGLAEAAKELDVQIFATTHSHECIEAAHAAFSSRNQYDFSVLQLFRIENGVQGRVLDKQHIEAALEGDIELR